MTTTRFLTTLASVSTFAFVTTPTASAAVIAGYEMGQAGPQTQNFVEGGDITAGSDAVINLNYNFGSGFPEAPVIQLDPNAGSSNTTVALDNGRLFFFDLTVSATTTDLDISSFSIQGAKNGSSSRDFGAGFQVDTGTGFGSRIDFVFNVGLTTERPSIASFGPYDLSGQASLQNLVAGNVVRFLVAEDNDFSASFDNIVIQGEGTAVAIPEPASLALLAAGGLCLLPRRRR